MTISEPAQRLAKQDGPLVARLVRLRAAFQALADKIRQLRLMVEEMRLENERLKSPSQSVVIAWLGDPASVANPERVRGRR